MQTYRLRHRDHTTLFEGNYRSTRECLEDALQRKICLDGASFANLDLSEVNLDGCVLTQVDFSGANLSGANISEGRLIECNFTNASLFNVCFAYSDLSGSIFAHAGFGGTDICGAILDSCLFAGRSSLLLAFYDCLRQDGAVFKTSMRHCRMSVPPLVITGLEYPAAVFDDEVMIGETLFQTKNGIWLQDNADIAAHEIPPLHPDLHKSMAALQRLRDAHVKPKTVAIMKSTKS